MSPSVLAAKGVVRDVGRVLDLPYSLCDTIAKMIPGDLGMTLDKALTMNPDLKKAYNEMNRSIISSTCPGVWRDCPGIPPCMRPEW